MSMVQSWHIEKLLARTAKALEGNFFKAASFSDREGLLQAIEGLVGPGMRVGFGGSVTLRELALIERLGKTGATLLDHWREGLKPEDIQRLRIEQMTSDIFVTGANAITEKGEIVNIDGIGNRVNAMTFGPKKIIIVAGYNKIVPDIEGALDRIRRVAAPMNAKRLNLSLPCAETGYCHDCKSEARICRIISILQRRPGASDTSVFLLNEALGY